MSETDVELVRRTYEEARTRAYTLRDPRKRRAAAVELLKMRLEHGDVLADLDVEIADLVRT